jgi:hypothetical protein
MTEGIDNVFENVYNFLGYVIYFFNPVSVPQEESGQKRQKKCIGSGMSEKTIVRLFNIRKKVMKMYEIWTSSPH